mgnify:CR=1 FL=1
MKFKEPLKVFELASKINHTSNEIITIAHKLKMPIYSIKCIVEVNDAKEIYKNLKTSQKILIPFDEMIKIKFQKMTSVDDLVDILNLVNKELYGEKTKPLELKFLTYHAFHSNKKFREFEIPKKTGGVRKICSPTKSLKNILSTLSTTLHYIHKSHKSSHGFEKDKSIVIPRSFSSFVLSPSNPFNALIKAVFPWSI